MNLFTFTDEFRHPLFESRAEVSKKELFLAPTAAVFSDVDHATAILGTLLNQVCILILTLDERDYVQIGVNAWALSINFVMALPDSQQKFFIYCLLKNLNHIAEINDERDSLAMELKNFKNQFKELNNDFLIITKKMEYDNNKKLSQKDALIYASQKIGKNGGFEINLITKRTESTPFLLEMLAINDFDPLSAESILGQISSAKFQEAIEKLRENENSESFEIEYDDGKRNRYFQVDLVALKRHDGKVLIVQGSLKDISILKNLEKENEKQKAIAVTASKLASLGEMAGGVAHEINNPMAIIAGLLYKLRRRFESNDLDLKEFYSLYEKAQMSIKRITYIVAGLRNFSRDGSNDQMEMKSIRSILEDTISFCETKFKQDGISLDYCKVDNDLEILCRPIEISQVFLNLISNATDAISELDEKWIRFETQKFDKFINIIVTDSGAGIDPSIIDKIVNPFFTTKAFGKGTGLGLSISHGIAKRYGGSLEVNRDCEHTQFVLQIPVAGSVG